MLLNLIGHVGNSVIGNEDLSTKRVFQSYKPHGYGANDSRLTTYLHHVTNIHKIGEHQRQSGQNILYNTLGTESHSEANHRSTSKVRRQRNAQFPQYQTYSPGIDNKDKYARA